MSLADRFRRWFRGDAADPGASTTPSEPGAASDASALTSESASAPPASAPPGPGAEAADDADGGGPSLASRLAASTDDAGAVALFDELARARGEGDAIAQARRALAGAPLPTLRVRVARALDARGDDEAVEAVLSRMPETAQVPLALLLEAWSRRAEVAERRNDPEAARVLWERVLSRDVTYPRARERVAQLRGGTARAPGDGGATVMAEGALTRGRYRVRKELGRGGAGTVFLAEDVGLGREVALKVYHRRGRADRERLLHEGRVPTELEHPGVVTVLDVDVALFALAMELTDGSVKDASREGALEPLRVLAWARSLVETLAWLHGRGIVHRDLKPSNMLLRRGRVVLTDFGLAARIGGAGEPVVAGGGEGTSGYMPPEQRRGEPASVAMDVHALGVSVDEMLGWTTLRERPAALSALLAAMRAPEAPSRPSLGEIRATLETLG